MSIFYINLLKTVNGVPFGEKRQRVREAFGDDFKEMSKTLFSKNTMDAYSNFHIFYTPDDTFEAIEIFPENNIIVDGKNIEWTYSAVQTWLKEVDSTMIINTEGILSNILSVGIYAPNGKIESILCAGENYFI